MDVGQKIKELRKEKRITQRELGERMKISQQQIAQYENGKLKPKIETVKKIADALNVSIDELMPDSYERDIQMGYELMATDYDFIKGLAAHKIFSDEDRKKIFQKVEHYETNLAKINNIDELSKYSKKTHDEIENFLLKILLDKPYIDVSYVIVLLSCFFSLKDRDQAPIIELLLNNFYK